MRRGSLGRLGAVALIAVSMMGTARAADVPTDRPLTVEECVSVALARSPSLGMARAEVQSAEGQRLSTWSGVLPRISAGASTGRIHANNQRSRREFVGTPVDVRSPAYDINSYSYDVTASMSVFDWSKWRSLSASASSIAGARAGEESSREGVAYSVRHQFYEYLKSIKLAGVARDAEDLARRQLERTQALFDLGSVTRGDVLSARVDVAQNELNRISAENSVQVQQARLARVMGLPVEAPLQIVEEMGALVKGVAPEPGTGALSNRGDVRQGRYQIDGARASLGAARAGYLPTVGVQWSYQWSDSRRPDFFDSFDYNTRWSAFLSLSVPIFDGLSTRGSVTQAKASVLTRERSQRDLELQAGLEIEEARLAIDQAEKQVASATEGVALAEENHRLRQQMYEVGAATLLEVQTAQVDLTRSRVSEIEALAALRQAEALYEKVTGRAE
jgi:outer membrane protein TolC